MAKPSLEIGMEFPELTELRKQLRELPKNIAAKHMGAALRAAMQPGVAALRKNTPKGPTGNLRKSIKIKVKKYPKDGNAVGIVGYETGKGSKGYHQYWLEQGTKERHTKGRIASSWAKRGQFRVVNPKRGKNAGKLVTNPKSPKAFFKAAKAGERVSLSKMPVGGRTGVPPVKTSFTQSQAAMRSVLQKELSTRLEKAIAEVKGRVARGLIT
jgi:HK97 gp10 family phage protein